MPRAVKCCAHERSTPLNIGTAPTDEDHDLSWAALFNRVQMAGASQVFAPPLEPNGGSYRGTIQIDLEQLQFDGDWELVIECAFGINKGFSDAAYLPFTVSHTDGP